MLIFWPMTVDSAPPGRLWRGSQTHSSQGLSNQHYDFSRVIVQVPINLHLQKKKKKISPNSDNLRLIDIKAKHKTVCVLLSRNTRGLDLWISHLHINNKENHKLHWHQSHNVTGLSTPPPLPHFISGYYLLKYASLQNSSVHPPFRIICQCIHYRKLLTMNVQNRNKGN